jgi:peptidoglycan/LPS O-acetylase OafA/YrhL
MANALGWRSIPIEPLGHPPGSSRTSSLDVPIDPLESGRVQVSRGIACLLLVAFHTIGASSASGLHVPDDSPWREFTNLVVHVRMPLFTFLSGFVYALRPVRPGQAWAFAGKKLRRLGVPLIVASTLLYGLHAAMHHQVAPLAQVWTIYVFPYWHLWFVQALMVVFAAVIVLEAAGAMAAFSRFMIVFTFALALYFVGPFQTWNVFGLHNASYLLPFFLCGLGAHRYRELLQSKLALVATVLCFIVAQGFHTYVVLTRTLAPIEPVDTRSGLNLAIGVSAGLCALQLLPRMRVMERIGGSSYVIYLYHPLFVAAVLFVAGTHGATARWLTFVGAGMAGVTGPMVVERLARRVPRAQLLLEGRVTPVHGAAERLRVVRDPVSAVSSRRGSASPARRWQPDRPG